MRWSATISAALIPGPRLARALGAAAPRAAPAAPASSVVAISAAPGRAATSRSARCGASAGNGRRAVGTALAPRRGGLVGVEHAGSGGARQHPVARGPRRLRGAVRPPRLGRLRQRDEQRGLGRGQAARLLAEPGEARGAHPLEVAADRARASGRAPRIASLSSRRSSASATRICRSLPRSVAGRALLEEARDLHRQRRAAGDDAARRAATAARRGPAPAGRRRDGARKRRSSKATSWSR